jgi:hypothetical protein
VPCEVGKTPQLITGIGILEQSADVWSITHGDGLIVTDGGDVEEGSQNPEL